MAKKKGVPVIESDAESDCNEYVVKWSENGSHHARVYAKSKIDAINRALNREGEGTYENSHDPFDLTCVLKDDEYSLFFDDDDAGDSEDAEDEQLYSVAWQEILSYKFAVSAGTKIHAINEAMLISERSSPVEWSRPYSIACDRVGNEHNDDGFQDD